MKLDKPLNLSFGLPTNGMPPDSGGDRFGFRAASDVSMYIERENTNLHKKIEQLEAEKEQLKRAVEHITMEIFEKNKEILRLKDGGLGNQ